MTTHLIRKHYKPFMPKVGPCDGCLKVAIAFLPCLTQRAWTRPKVVVLFPSPNGVGVILFKK